MIAVASQKKGKESFISFHCKVLVTTYIHTLWTTKLFPSRNEEKKAREAALPQFVPFTE